MCKIIDFSPIRRLTGFQGSLTKKVIMIILVILACSLILIFRRLEISDIENVHVEIYSGGAVSLDYEYNDKFKDKKQIKDWMSFNNSSLYHLTWRYYVPEAVLTFNDGKAIIIFNQKSIMCYMKDKRCMSYYSRERQEIDDLFLESLRSVEK